MDRNKIYLKAIEKWGVRAQYEMAQEEATELALAVRKHIRMNNHESFNHLAEEIADVKIMIEQLELINPYFKSVSEDFIVAKIERLAIRVEQNDFEAK